MQWLNGNKIGTEETEETEDAPSSIFTSPRYPVQIVTLDTKYPNKDNITTSSSSSTTTGVTTPTLAT
jgi:hypothetical protein